MWLRANKLSLNIEKIELVVFQRQNTKLNNSFKIKLDGKRLFPTSSVKYLGVLLDEHLTWSPQISHVQMRLNRAIGILSKLRYQANIHILKMVTILFLAPSYLCLPLMGSKQQRKAKQISNSPEQSTNKIAFLKQYESADPLYKNLKIIMFPDLFFFMCQLEQNKKLTTIFPGLVYIKEKHNYNIRSARKNLLDIPLCQTVLIGCNHANTNALKIGTDSRRKTQQRT